MSTSHRHSLALAFWLVVLCATLSLLGVESKGKRLAESAEGWILVLTLAGVPAIGASHELKRIRSQSPSPEAPGASKEAA